LEPMLSLDVGYLIGEQPGFISPGEFAALEDKHGATFRAFQSSLKESQSSLTLSFAAEESLPVIKSLAQEISAKYEDVLMQMMRQVAAGLSAREDRKNVLFSMKLTLVAISITALIIVWLIGAGLGIDVKGSLTENTIGQYLLFVSGVLYLFVLTKLFGTDK